MSLVAIPTGIYVRSSRLNVSQRSLNRHLGQTVGLISSIAHSDEERVTGKLSRTRRGAYRIGDREAILKDQIELPVQGGRYFRRYTYWL